MRATRRVVLLACILAAIGPTAVTRAETASNEATQAAFDRLRGLAGEWVETEAPYRQVSYRVIANDAVVIEEFRGEPAMSTFYHLDGDDLFLTHYCNAGNQPRMRATRPDAAAASLRFAFEDITNLAAPDAYHTRDLELTFRGDDHLELRFSGRKEGRDVISTVRLERRRDNR